MTWPLSFPRPAFLVAKKHEKSHRVSFSFFTCYSLQATRHFLAKPKFQSAQENPPSAK